MNINKICIHCLRECEDNNLTWDHVFPESWYPKGVHVDDKWKIPCCKECNNRLSRVEKDLLIAFTFCCENTSKYTMERIDRIKRSMDSSKGKSEKDSLARIKDKEKFKRNLKVVGNMTEGVFPSLDNRYLYDNSVTDYLSITVSADDIQKFTKKIIKGIVLSMINDI
jgi:hypothetical protein